MKTTIKLGNIEFNGLKLENIEFTQEYNHIEAIQLMTAGKKFVQDLTKELPEMLDDLYLAFNKFNEIDAKVAMTETMSEREQEIASIEKELNALTEDFQRLVNSEMFRYSEADDLNTRMFRVAKRVEKYPNILAFETMLSRIAMLNDIVYERISKGDMELAL
jgi:hypothetical protein